MIETPGLEAKTRVGLLFGGRSPEHEVSITTAMSIAEHADPSRVQIVPIYIARDGRWLRMNDAEQLIRLGEHEDKTSQIEHLAPDEVLLSATRAGSLVSVTPVGRKSDPLDVLFPAVHGPGGEDGSIQGLARLMDVPCVGAGILGSALGLDKISTKQIALAHKVPISPFIATTRSHWQHDSNTIRETLNARFEKPVFVKPSNAGSSIGVTKLTEFDQLDAAISEALRYDHRIVIEQGINARELEVAILGNSNPEASVVGEVIPDGEFYDYRGKYIAQGSRLIIPAGIRSDIAERIKALALRMFLALDVAGMARVDFLLDKGNEELYFNEVNTIPGFTQISMYPMLWEASGIDYRSLITRLVDLAVEHHNESRVDLQPPASSDLLGE